jgi:hypothetical protein
MPVLATAVGPGAQQVSYLAQIAKATMDIRADREVAMHPWPLPECLVIQGTEQGLSLT